MVDKKSVKKRRRKKRVIWGTIISSICVAALIVVAFLSSYVGNFTISVIDYDAHLGLLVPDEEGGSDGSTTSFLKLDPFDNATPYTVSEINLSEEKIDSASLGNKSGQVQISTDYEVKANLYFAYTFYVVNLGEGPAYHTYGVSLNETALSNDLMSMKSYLRIRVYENVVDDITKAEEHEHKDFIQQPRSYSESEMVDFNQGTRDYVESCLDSHEKGSLNYFKNDGDTIVLEEGKERLYPGQKVRYTFVMWLEGNDPECTNDYLGGQSGLRLSLYVSGQSAEEN